MKNCLKSIQTFPNVSIAVVLLMMMTMIRKRKYQKGKIKKFEIDLVGWLRDVVRLCKVDKFKYEEGREKRQKWDKKSCVKRKKEKKKWSKGSKSQSEKAENKHVRSVKETKCTYKESNMKKIGMLMMIVVSKKWRKVKCKGWCW